MSTILWQVKRTQKQRRCDWCGGVVDKGEPSTVMAAIWDSDFVAVRMHPECDEGWQNTDFLYHEEWHFREQERGQAIPSPI